MAGRKVLHAKHLAKLADKNVPCAFCKRSINDETVFGKLYNIGDIYCHYFCVLLSCCLIQKGKDHEGLFGFMYPDIVAEIERSKRHRCSYCNISGATLGCSIAQCKKQFHLPCGRERNAVSLFYGNYKSYCEKHAPKQKLADVLLNKANTRLAKLRKIKREGSLQNLKKIKRKINKEAASTVDEPEIVCAICYEPVEGYPTTQTFWPPCCARDAWFHRSCLQRMALSAGVHFLKCPLCNNKEIFSRAVLSQGYYIPDRDAAWELEQNAFSEIYERAVVCRAEDCKCPRGREFDADTGMWVVKLCVLCGSAGSHSACCAAEYYVCAVCGPAAPDQTHLAAIDAVSLPSQNQSSQSVTSGPIMPSRMSLRRTKHNCRPSQSSQNVSNKFDNNESTAKSNTVTSREDLNLKEPKRPKIQPTERQTVSNELLSPLKLLKHGLNEKMPTMEVENVLRDSKVVEKMREKLKRPKPLCAKRKIVQKMLDEIVDYLTDGFIKESNSVEHWNDRAKPLVPDENTSLIESGTLELEKKHILDGDMSPNIDHAGDLFIQSFAEGKDKNAVIELEKSEISANNYPSNMKRKYKEDSSDIHPIIDTTKKLTKINIENDSMEISENNQTVNVDLVKVSNETTNDSQMSENKCALKIYPINKDSLDTNMDIDLESFKNQYLNEVDRKLCCKFGNSIEIGNPEQDHSDLDSEMPTEELVQPNHSAASKKRKSTILVRKVKKRNDAVKTERNERQYGKENTELSIRNRDMNLKIRFKADDIKLKFKRPKRRVERIKNGNLKVLRQYVLHYPSKYPVSSRELIARPDTDVTPPKRRYLKSDKSSDNLKQTSIESFFKRSPTT